MAAFGPSPSIVGLLGGASALAWGQPDNVSEAEFVLVARFGSQGETGSQAETGRQGETSF